VHRAVTGALGASSRIDGYMEKYEKIRRGEDAALRGLEASTLNLFIISLFVVVVAGFGGLVNFELIARPMSELVPSGGWILGMPVSKIAALVIVLMGITHLFPRLSGLAASRRRIIFLVALAGLFLLAAIEASLAVLREQLFEADKALAMALSGEAARGKESVAAPLLSHIPMLGQAVLGFILPWILAMIAVPLEMLVESGRHVVGRALDLLVRGLTLLFRLLAHLMRYLFAALTHIFDIYIVIPLQVERLFRGRGAPSPVESTSLRNPTERTQPFKAPR